MHITIQHATASAVLLVAETEKGPVQRTVRPGESAWGWSFDLWSKQASGLMEALVVHVMGFFEAQHEAEPLALAAALRQAVAVIEERIRELETAGA